MFGFHCYLPTAQKVIVHVFYIKYQLVIGKIKIKPDPDPKAAPAWSDMLIGNEFRFWRQVGTGLAGRDRRETRCELPQPPPIIMMN